MCTIAGEERAVDGKVCCLPRVLQYQYERGKISCRRLEWEGGAVSSRVALLLRSAEAQPYLPRFVRFSELFFFFSFLFFFFFCVFFMLSLTDHLFVAQTFLFFWLGSERTLRYGPRWRRAIFRFFEFFSLGLPMRLAGGRWLPF